jgi:hypothetical protein
MSSATVPIRTHGVPSILRSPNRQADADADGEHDGDEDRDQFTDGAADLVSRQPAAGAAEDSTSCIVVDAARPGDA